MGPVEVPFGENTMKIQAGVVGTEDMDLLSQLIVNHFILPEDNIIR